jgi:hypothetical protein
LLDNIYTSLNIIRFLGSNTAPSSHNSPLEGGKVSCEDLLDISDGAWTLFQEQYKDSSQLLYIDDSARENLTTYEPSATNTTTTHHISSLLFHSQAGGQKCGNTEDNLASPGVEEEAIWALCRAPSADCDVSPLDAVLSTLPTFVDPELFSIPGSE